MLNIRNLQTGYKNSFQLSMPDITLQAGQKILLSGNSGSGKTTLLNALAGLADDITGHIIINNTDLYALSESRRDSYRGKNIAILFQDLHLISTLNVEDNIRLPALLNNTKIDEDMYHAAIQKLGLDTLKKQKPPQLSRGQAQRVALARTLFSAPQLILADEPTSALDNENAQIVKNLIFEIAAKTNAILFISSHDNRITSGFDTRISMTMKKMKMRMGITHMKMKQNITKKMNKAI